jgi:parallel beta-helix repeat protein
MRAAMGVASTFLLVVSLSIMLMIPSTMSLASNTLDNTIVVPDDYPTIQAAIAAATDGSTILVKPGVYKECLTIGKPLNLVGSGPDSTTIESAGEADTVLIARGVVGALVKGFSVQGNGEAPWSGIYVGGLNNTVEDTVVTGSYYGIQMWDCSRNILRSNNMTGNTYNLRVYGLAPSQFLQDIDSSNYVNGKPVLYWINQQNRSVPSDVGCVVLVNSSRITVRDLRLSNNLAGVVLAYTTNSLIVNVTALNNEIGLWLVCSNNNTIVGGDFSGSAWDGIETISSSGNTIMGNEMNGNVYDGVRLSHSFDLVHSYSENNTVSDNLVSNNTDGLYLEASNYNVVEGNLVKRNTDSGIVLDGSAGNLLFTNTMVNNAHGVLVSASKDKLYHNNFMNNSVQAGSFPFSAQSLNVWDDGYPSGGNYWSDYNGTDSRRGPYQNETGRDGIGDVPYTIDLNNTDRYPLVHPYGSIRNLNTNLTYLTIQSAIDAPETLSGDVIFVKDGTYYENVVLNRSISLIGESQADTIIDGSSQSDVVFLSTGNCVISGFTIRNGGLQVHAYCGVNIFDADGNIVCGNTFIGNFIGVSLGNKIRGSMSNIVRYNNITRNHYGIFLAHSNRNEIYGNIVSNNEWNGIELDWSDGNIIYDNTISNNNAFGFEIPQPTPGRDNLIYHNNFINNSLGVSASMYGNTWDDGYPSGGNYWDDYRGADLFSGPFQNIPGTDGIGDTPRVIDQNNVDHFPLMGFFYEFNTSLGYQVAVISNSTIEDFQYLQSDSTIKMRVSNTTANQAFGFCRVSIPHTLMNPSNITVLIDDGTTSVCYKNLALYDNGTQRWIYFAYSYPVHEIVIAREFPLLMMLSAFMIVTAIVIIAFRRKRT